MFDPHYEAQARLLLRCLPEVHRHQCFAVKGGTAINLFLRDLPRLSVDIDLTYMPLRSRRETLRDIHDSLNLIKEDIEQDLPDSKVKPDLIQNHVAKLFVTTDDATITIEPNLILRGSIHPPQNLDLSPAAQEHFRDFLSVQTLSTADLYGGKLCAALDRQHPRDLFDVKLLLDDTGITPDIRRAFVVYLAGHNRPMNELLDPRFKDIEEIHKQQFAGMVRIEVPIKEMKKIQQSLAPMLVESIDDKERQFLLSLKQGEPDWNILGIEKLDQLPAIQWKLINIRKMDQKKRNSALERLRRVLDV